MKSQNLSKLFGHIMTVSLECGVYLGKVGTRQVARHPRLRESGPQTAPRSDLIGRGLWLASAFACLLRIDFHPVRLDLSFFLVTLSYTGSLS